ncbi:MAG TPA: hypothetical protein VEK76_03140 [Candidatus Binatia bacterium]|nr:hypothetical protein [Candidatus Binatia bacterium]
MEDQLISPPLMVMTSRAMRLVAARGHRPGEMAGATWLALGGPPPDAPAWRQLRWIPTVNCTRLSEVAELRTRSGPDTRAVALYDLEAWDLTPREEREDPWTYVARAADLLRASRLELMAAPSISLATRLARDQPGPELAYLACRLAERMAPRCCIYHIQSQRLERVPERYSAFVAEVARRARQASPTVLVTAGLSTNPTGAPVSLEQLAGCVAGTYDRVDGYWINVPRPGRRCPHCNPENPALAAALLAQLVPAQGHVRMASHVA